MESVPNLLSLQLLTIGELIGLESNIEALESSSLMYFAWDKIREPELVLFTSNPKK